MSLKQNCQGLAPAKSPDNSHIGQMAVVIRGICSQDLCFMFWVAKCPKHKRMIWYHIDLGKSLLSICASSNHMVPCGTYLVMTLENCIKLNYFRKFQIPTLPIRMEACKTVMNTKHFCEADGMRWRFSPCSRMKAPEKLVNKSTSDRSHPFGGTGYLVLYASWVMMNVNHPTQFTHGWQSIDSFLITSLYQHLSTVATHRRYK